MICVSFEKGIRILLLLGSLVLEHSSTDILGLKHICKKAAHHILGSTHVPCEGQATVYSQLDVNQRSHMVTS